MSTTAKTLRSYDRFPSGTSVKVYPATAFRPGAEPAGTPIATVSAGAGGVALTGLPADRMLVTYAFVNGEHRYVHTSSY